MTTTEQLKKVQRPLTVEVLKSLPLAKLYDYFNNYELTETLRARIVAELKRRSEEQDFSAN